MTRSVDLNADLGEGFGRWALGDDVALMPLITSANVACGFHAGDPSIIRGVCESAVTHGVTVGAHVSYPDLAGFGRRFIEMRQGELTDAVVYQLGALDGLARASGTRVMYVKPHGALYNAIVHHDEQAAAVADAVAAYDPSLPLMGLADSAVERAATARGLRFVMEGFADRGYTDDRRLVARTKPGALLTDPVAVARQAVELVSWGVESICVHSDTPNAVQSAIATRAALLEIGATLQPFAR
jgi:UPF0271 protein